MANSNKSIFIIEMQNFKSGMSCFRVMYYWSKAFLEQVLSNKSYTELLPCYAVLITDYNFNNSNNCVSEYSVKFENFELDCLKLFVIQLPKFNKETADLSNIEVELISAPADSDLVDEEFTLRWDASENEAWTLRSVNNATFDEEGTYEFKVTLENGASATAKMTVKEFYTKSMGLFYREDKVVDQDGT